MIRRKGTSWEVVVFAGRDPVTGKERRVSRSVPGAPHQKRPPKAARDLEARLIVEVGQGRHREAHLTVGDLLAHWLAHVEPTLSPTTIAGYRSKIDRYLLPNVGRTRLDRLTTATLDRLYGRLRASGGQGGSPLSPATIRQAHAVLRRALHQAQRWGWTTVNPAALASPPSIETTERTPPSKAEIARLLEHAGPMVLPIWLAAVTGVRRAELCGLRYTDIDVDAGTVTVARSVVEVGHRLHVKPAKTRRSHRIVAIGPRTAAMLRARRAEAIETALAFGAPLRPEAYLLSESPDGVEPLHPNLVSDRFRVLARRLGISCRFHDLRHAHVTDLIASGVPVTDVAARAGHASTKMTLDVYGHAVSEWDRRAAALAEEGLG